MPNVRVNEHIVAREVRVIDQDGTQIGILPLEEARALAQRRNLDLVEVASVAKPPVCRVMDHGKFMFDRQKRERDKRKVQSRIEVKEVRLSPRTGEHDLQIVLARIRRFIDDGAKVKVRIRFRGRERFNPQVGLTQLHKISKALSDVAQIEAQPAPEGNTLLMTLGPLTPKRKQKPEPALTAKR